MEMDRASFTSPDGKDIFQLFSRFPAEIPQALAKSGDIIPDLFRRRPFPGRIGERHPHIPRMKIAVQQVETSLPGPLVLPPLHLFRRRLFPSAPLVFGPHPAGHIFCDPNDLPTKNRLLEIFPFSLHGPLLKFLSGGSLSTAEYGFLSYPCPEMNTHSKPAKAHPSREKSHFTCAIMKRNESNASPRSFISQQLPLLAFFFCSAAHNPIRQIVPG
jgi:hypothetical protein